MDSRNFKSSYFSHKDKSTTQALEYVRTHNSTHRYLAYRDVPELLSRFVRGNVALDYGTGSGCSAGFLKSLGFNVAGADISKQMLDQAKSTYPDLQFHQIENGTLPDASGIYDLVFSSFVLFEIGDQEGMISYLSEAKRVLKKGGIFLAVTGSEHLHLSSSCWLNFKTDFPENIAPKSGELVRLYLYDSDIEFTDYYWTERDYFECFSRSGLEVVKVVYPLGKEDEIYPWKDESNIAPFVILLAQNSGISTR